MPIGRGGVTCGSIQQSDGMSEIRGRLDPEARAVLEAVFAKWAAPGMCNPDDEKPCLDGDPSPEAVSGDYRSTGQRNHDALKALCRAMLASGQLGSHKGLPVTMVISTTLAELESGKGHAVTGGGSLLPMSEVIRQAAAAHHYLVVFDDHTECPLYLGRSRRLASAAQRIVLYARDRGCTRPGCTAPAYHSEAHHDDGWAAARSPTDIDKLSLACAPRQPAHRGNRLDDPKTQRRPHRMDPTTPPRHRPSPRQQLPPPRAIPHPRRRERRRRGRRRQRQRRTRR